MSAALFDKHRVRFERAQQACRERHAWSAFPELPTQVADAEAAQARGIAAYRARLGRRFEIDQPGTLGWLGEEVSPYTGEPLGVDYPRADIEALFEAAERAIPRWAEAGARARIGVLMEAVDRLFAGHVFELQQAVMHSAGQSANMAYAGSGANALDRAIEALVYADMALAAVTPNARWERSFGSTRIELAKTYRAVPRGVAVCFACASFATWNAWPSMMASLPPATR